MVEVAETPPTAGGPLRTRVRRATGWRTIAQWSIAVALLAAAWLIVAVLPPTFHRFDAFAVVGDPDSTTTSRTMEVTLADMTVTTHVSGERGEMMWEVDGNWVVIDLIATGREDGVTLNYARLVVDGISYPATDRVDSFFGSALRTDFPQSGSLAFQVPAAVLDQRGELQIGTPPFKALDVLLDDVITIPLDLSALPRTDEAVIDLVEWAAQ